jgi:hypothetical protein
MLACVWLEAPPPGTAPGALERLLRALATWSPVLEPEDTPGFRGAYMDARGLELQRFLRGLRRQVSQPEPADVWPAGEDDPTGAAIEPLHLRTGLAKNRLVAKLVALAAPPGRWRLVEPAATRAFLEPLLVGLLPLSEESQERLSLLGIRTIGRLLRLPRAALGGQVGPDALAAARALEAEGELLRPWRGDAWLAGEAEVDGPLETRAQLRLALEPLLARLVDELRERRAGAQTVRVRAAGRDRRWRERCVYLPERTAELDGLLAAAEQLAEALAGEIVTPETDLLGPERLEVALGDLGRLASRQPGLFEAQHRRALAAPALAELRARFGSRVQVGAGMAGHAPLR